MSFDLTAWASAAAKRRRIVKLRPISASVGFESGLRFAAMGWINEAERFAREYLIAEATPLVMDDAAGFARRMAQLRLLIEQLLAKSDDATRSLFKAEGERHTKAWFQRVRDALGIDLAGVVSEREIAEALALATNRNIALIRGLSDETAKRIETTIPTLMIQGAKSSDIAKALRDSFGIARRRAKLIARDQAAKWNASLTQIRQTQAGITQYEWSTSQDERVRGNPSGKYPNARPSHWDREGDVFSWDKPPEDGHPGQPINCRCVAIAVVAIEPASVGQSMRRPPPMLRVGQISAQKARPVFAPIQRRAKRR